MGSSRLPGKVMLDLCGRPVIHHVIDRVLESRLIDMIVIATTVDKKDDVLVVAVNNYHPRVVSFRGSEDDVLERYYQAAREYGIDTIVRITSDCPLIEPEVIDDVVRRFADGEYDYVSNVGDRSFPRGLDTEVFSFSALERAWREAVLPSEREHVTPYIRNHKDRFPSAEVSSSADYSSYRWTLDTIEDWRFIQVVYNELYQGKSYFHWLTVLEVLGDKPEIVKINADVQQKTS
ncbi:MAG: glycosyltransferase family protein [Firmicutes bacterium]|nr:glycosyltransferase family protein [Bacillota bacterium]